MTAQTKKIRVEIGSRIRDLREEGRWTQTQFADLLGISQNYLSVLERGQGSFTAEQLLIVIRRFNVPISYFSSQRSPAEDQLQNALARLGAGHLLELELLPSELLKEAAETIRETLLAASSARQITAIAPVLVSHIRNLNLPKLRAQLTEAGIHRRLSWVIENTLEAVRRELRGELPREIAVAYRQAELLLREIVESWQPPVRQEGHVVRVDFFDPDIASEESEREVRDESSEISKRWRILTRIQVDDFVRALRAARG